MSIIHAETPLIWLASPTLLDSIRDEGTRQWYFWQPGVLQFSTIPAAPGYLGGLVPDRTELLCVQQALYQQYRRQFLEEQARAAGMTDEHERRAFCLREEHALCEAPGSLLCPALIAENNARQVPFWLSQREATKR